MEYIFTVILGVVCIIIGILNTKGNISMLHSYHRKRVTEENRLPFGKAVGLGMIIIGVSFILFGTLMFTASCLEKSFLSVIASIALIVGLVLGLGINFYAMFKYNKGIF